MEETPNSSSAAARLVACVAAFRDRAFAVIDGAHFDDLTAVFRRDRLFARSLFLDHADPAVQRAGPWLVDLSQEPEAAHKVFAIVGDRPAAIYWACRSGEAVLWRHLRTLNMARLPDWAQNGTAPAEGPTVYDSVFFRHYDPTVLGSLLPILDAGQFSRVLGPAEELAFRAEEYGGFRRLVKDPGWPPAPSGLLTIRPDQIDMLRSRRVRASHRRLAGFLRETAPDETAHRSDAELYQDVLRYEQSGAALGLSSERSQGRWAHLVVATNGALESSPSLRRYIAHGPGSPDHNLEIVFDRMVLLARSDLPRGR